MFYVGFCPLCEQGAAGVRTCGYPGHVVVVCDECDAMWRTPDLAGEPVLAGPADLACPRCGTSLQRPPARWATWEEIERAGWQDAVIGQGPALG